MIKNRNYWTLFFAVLILLGVFTFIGMMVYSPKEELNASGFIYEFAEYYLNLFNGIGSFFTSIKEGHILNYFISHLLFSFVVSGLLFALTTRKTSNS